MTYSLTAPAEHPWVRQRDRLYATVHAALVDALAALGVAARRFASRPPCNRPPANRCCVFNVAPRATCSCGTVKVAGSAQRRRRGAVLQHGSVLWRVRRPRRNWLGCRN